MTERKRGRARWLNVYERADGMRYQDKTGFCTRAGAEYAARSRWYNNKWKLAYRIRVRYFTEPVKC